MTHATLKSYILSLVLRYKTLFIAIPVLVLISQIFAVTTEYQIKNIIDAIESGKGKNIGIQVLLFGLFLLLDNSCYFIKRLIDVKYKPKMMAELVTDMYLKTMKQSLHWFDSHLSGEIASKITDFQEGVITSERWIFCSLCNITSLIIALVFLSTIHYLIAFAMLGFILIYGPVMGLLLKKQLIIQEEYVKSRQKAVGVINDSISNIFGIKIIGNVANEFKIKLLPAIFQWKDRDKKARYYDAWYVDLTDTLLTNLLAAGMIGLAAYLYKNNEITAGDFAFIAISMMSAQLQLEELLDHLLFNLNPKIAMVKSSYAFLNTAPHIGEMNGATNLPRVKGRIEYKNVSFGYSADKTIFDNFNLSIKSGERIGIVGTSGAGKTTFIKCLLRYFDIKRGSILIDGHDISSVTQESLRENISVIPQDISMFHRSVLENLQIAKADATEEEIYAACKKARIHEDIELMEHGYDSIVGERGVKVSGGQRQRIAIARAILKNAPILILDEATSALDTPTEKLIQESINEMLDTNKATTIVIAHRLSTLLHMDRILVFEKGRIAQEGKHEELVAKDGIYRKLWSAQAGGFLPEE